jgi:hypothetical protein
MSFIPIILLIGVFTPRQKTAGIEGRKKERKV